MKDLKCALKECKFNQGFSCVAEKISVDDSAHCASYELSLKKKADAMFEAGTDSTKPVFSVDTRVTCGAEECLFNRNNNCVANGITVLGDRKENKKEADCATFTRY